jgi:hypothetical protein
VPTSKKIDEHLQPRYLEDEGLYVGIRPKVSIRNENKLEDRLVHEPNGLVSRLYSTGILEIRLLKIHKRLKNTLSFLVFTVNPLLQKLNFIISLELILQMYEFLTISVL